MRTCLLRAGILTVSACFLSTKQAVSAEEREKRLNLLYHPYHASIEEYLEKREGKIKLIFSIHSFTDSYEGQKREMEVGVLFKDHDQLALKVGKKNVSKVY